ncbi:hypothetical protein JCM19052_2917 [Vibrio sp. JCM 19052]|nr:hypothetical protein JCM19052_2917 [Vibrio sp. JCM 19052]
MSKKTEVVMCPSCGVETHHVVVLVRKKSAFEGDKNRSKKEFISGFLKSTVFGAFLASMDEFSRHLSAKTAATRSFKIDRDNSPTNQTKMSSNLSSFLSMPVT